MIGKRWWENQEVETHADDDDSWNLEADDFWDCFEGSEF